jgi:hypothetical protein
MMRSRMLLSGILALSSVLGLSGCASRTPGSWETAFVYAVKRNITVGGTKDRNPLTPSDENIYAGQNTGVPFADKMSPPVPLLNSKNVQRYRDGQLKWIIEHGIFPSGMPASQGMFSDDEIWELVLYMRHLPAKGSLGEPKVYR